MQVIDNKLINDKGEVAVLVSPGFGAGWSTWNSTSPTDARYAQFIYNGDLKTAEELAEKEDQYAGGLGNCVLCWLLPGTEYYIDDYDGSEQLITKDTYNWKVA